MTFTSLTFICFLPLIFALYWILAKPKSQNILLIVASYVFYGWWDYRFCALILASSLVDFALGYWMDQSNSQRRRKALLVSSLVLNLGLLGLFKYFNFFAESFTAMAGGLGWSPDPITLNVILPVGISFYTFQTLSYTIDIYRRQIRASHSLINYLAFVSFFPQLVAGPIERASNLLPQFAKRRKFDLAQARSGCRLILWGFFKKVVIADRLAIIVDQVYSQPESVAGPLLAFATVCFAFQIYCDFSAYSDIAIGTARLFNITLMRNFAYPYFSQSINEFWHRWHISLSTWFRDYIYIPLGGSRQGSAKKTRNLLATFVVSGFWHGAGWQFLAWGGIHGGAVAAVHGAGRVTRRGKAKARHKSSEPNPKQTLTTVSATEPKHKSKRKQPVPGGERLIPHPKTSLKMLLTFSIVCLCWVFFRADSIGDACMIIGRIFTDIGNLPAWHALSEFVLDDKQTKRAVVIVLAFVSIEWLQRRKMCPLDMSNAPVFIRWTAYTLLLWYTLCYMTPSASQQFIYFEF